MAQHVDAALGQRLEHLRGNARIRADADADDADLDHVRVGHDAREADRRLDLLDHRDRLRQRRVGDGEGQVDCPRRTRGAIWTIMSTWMPASASGTKMAATVPGLSAMPVSVIRASFRSAAMPAIELAFHVRSSIFLGDDHPCRACPRMPTERCSGMFSRMARPTERICSTLAPTRRQLQHLLERHLVELARPWDDARVGRVDAVDVGVDVAAVGLDAGGDARRPTCPSRRGRASRRGRPR